MALTTAQRLKLGVAEKVVSAATATGVAAAQQFCLPGESGLYNGMVTVQAVRTVAGTALSADLEVSLDGGVTFNPLLAGAAFDFFAESVKQYNVNAGSAIYRINITAITGATVDFWVLAG